MLMFYLISSLIKSWFQPQGTGGTQQGNSSSMPKTAYPPSSNAFTFFDRMVFFMYITESDSKFTDFKNPTALFWHVENVKNEKYFTAVSSLFNYAVTSG